MSEEVILSPDDFVKCPICGKECKMEGGRGYEYGFHGADDVIVFLCYNPLATDPLHSYSHIIAVDAPKRIAQQEFEVDLGNKSILFTNNYQTQHTLIRNSLKDKPLELSFIIVPDFPSLTSLKKRVRTAIVFS
jgi:hypothetical protein